MALVRVLGEKTGMKHIAIIGGGASGVLTAIHILRATRASVNVTLYDPAKEIGAGLAYGTEAIEHILNVPADRMSCDEREPLDFVEWLKLNDPKVFNDFHYPFVSRMLFKRYLQDRLLAGSSKVEWKNSQVDSIKMNQGKCIVHNGGTTNSYDECVVATGYSPQTFIPSGLKSHLTHVVDAPYSADFKEEHLKTVAIIGMGLTAIDIWRSLRHNGFKGNVHFFSRRCLFPQAFSIFNDLKQTPEVPLGSSPLFLLRWVRALLRYENCDVATIANVLRPHVTDIWKQWTRFQKKQFLHHLRPYWDSIRHRLPDTVHSELLQELKTQKSFAHKAQGLRAESNISQTRLHSASQFIDVDRVYVATGARLNIEPLKIDSELYSKCDLGLGFESRHSQLHFVGPITRTTFWEVSAVPEIRLQAQAIAERLCGLSS